MPKAPVDIQDAVELYARDHGRTATLHFIPTLIGQGGRPLRGAWVARFSLRCNDKRMILYRDGHASEPPMEDVWFHLPNPKAGQPIAGLLDTREPDFVAIDIAQLGASGVRAFLEKGNTWSGRGEFASVEDQLMKTREANAAVRARFRAEQKEANRLEQREKRRWWFKIPFLPVQVDLRSGVTKREEKIA